MNGSHLALVMPAAGAPLQREVRPTPEPAPGEVLVQVGGSSLNFHDLVNLMGLIAGPWPRVPMSDGAGTIVALGDGVRDWSVGDRVFGAFHPNWPDGRLTRTRRADVPGDTGDGWLQRYVCARADAVVAVPAHLDDVEAATLCCAGTTAWSALGRAGIGPGDVVVTQGTGGVSLFAVQLAALRGATVIVTSSSDDKLAVAKSLGAHHGVNYRSTPDWQQAVRELTSGEGADLVIDLGGAGSLARSVRATSMDGHVAVIGVLDGAGDAPVPVGTVMQRQIQLFGVSVGSVAAHRALSRAVTASGLRPHLSHRVSWHDMDEAVRIHRANEHIGKIGITIDTA